MKQAWILVGCALMLSLFAASPAAAYSANFCGQCDTQADGSMDCSFTPTISCSPSTFWKANWSYGDGGTLFTGSTGTVNHTYNAPLAGGYSVQLSVYCLDGTVINVTRWLCVGGCVPGGIVPNTGTCN